MSDSLREVQAIFSSDAALQDGISRLTLCGFDRAEISLPEARPTAAEATPEQGAATPMTEEDTAQMRTMQTSMAGAAGAMAAAGVTIATGGAAVLAVAAAAAIGAGAAGLAHAVNRGANDVQHEEREAKANRGELVLSVLARDPEREHAAIEALRAAGALRVEPVTRVDSAIVA